MFLSIVIPTFNSAEYIPRCLNSVFSQGLPDIEVIVVDNGSDDSTIGIIQRDFPGVTLIRNRKNMGSSSARNQGIRASSAGLILFLDSDAYLEDGFFVKLADLLKDFPKDTAGVSPKIIDDKSHRIFSCGLKISSLYRVKDQGRGKGKDNFNSPMAIDGLNSCCAIIRRESLDKIKEDNEYFDEDFFFLFEDVDLSVRLKAKGYQFLFIPRLTCFHQGAGAPIAKDFRRFLCLRNRWYAILKDKKRKAIILRSLPYDLIRTLHFAATNRFIARAAGDIYRYWRLKREKTIDI